MKDDTNNIGRPTEFDKAIVLEICEKIITTPPEANSIKKICASDDKYPCAKSFFNWLLQAESGEARQELKDFLHQYRFAVLTRAEIYGEMLPEIAFNERRDILQGMHGEKGNSTAVSRDRLKMDALIYLMKVSNPAKYGEKVTTEHQFTDTDISGSMAKLTDAYLNEIKGKK